MKSMKSTLHSLLVLAALLLGGCATEWHSHTSNDADAASADNTQRLPALRLHAVQGTTQPEEGFTPITEADLQPGDILFSAEKTLVSAGILLINHAPVSHAFLYLGDGQIAEAVRTGVQIRPLAEVLQATSLAVAFRHPDLLPETTQAVGIQGGDFFTGKSADGCVTGGSFCRSASNRRRREDRNGHGRPREDSTVPW